MKSKQSAFIVLFLFATATAAQGPDTYVAVHCEPTHTYYYDSLVKMVALADSFGAPLTIEFNPQWADTILADPALLSQVRQWQAKGHEIAAHHHAVSYGAGGWDGFTNRPPVEYPAPSRYRGGMQDYFALLSRLAGDSLLLTGGITDWDVDWPVGLPFRTEGHNMDEALTWPVSLTFNGQAVTSLGYGVVNTRAKLDTAKILFGSGTAGDVLGIILHEKDFSDNPMNLRGWLQFLKTRNASVKTVRQIMRERGFLTGVRNRPHAGLPDGFVLFPAFPNPFNASTLVRFSVPQQSRIHLDVVDVSGRSVRTLADRAFNPGGHEIRFDAGDLSSGTYLIVLKSEGRRQVLKTLLAR